LSATAAVAIVGGGVVGASVAYHLAARSVRDVIVLDRESEPGAGSTGRATGGFRLQFAAATEVKLSQLSLAKLRTFHDETGGDCGYVPAGYLWLAQDETQLASLRAALAVQRTCGVNDARELDLAQIAEVNPYVGRDGLTGGTFCASDGFIRPLQMLDGYRRAAERAGARFVWGAGVVAFERARGGTIGAVRTAGETIAVGTVVNAAGPWAAQVAALAGTVVPVTPLRRQVAVTVPARAVAANTPMTLYAGDGFHLRERDGRVLLLLPSPGAPDAFDLTVEPAWIEAVTRIARERVACLAGIPIDRTACWAGLYEMSPDGHAIIGTATGVPNLYFANGSSGHGVMHAPALGQLIAEMIVDGAATSLDVTALRPDRFADLGAQRASELL
jgi:sarcosine oxidase subunit beta